MFPIVATPGFGTVLIYLIQYEILISMTVTLITIVLYLMLYKYTDKYLHYNYKYDLLLHYK